MRKLEEDGVKRKELRLAWAIMARNSIDMLGYSLNQEVFGHHRSALGSVSVEDMMTPQLETNTEGRKLKELLETQELVRSNYQSQE